MKPHILFAGMTSWYLNHTAQHTHEAGCLGCYWMGNKRPQGIPLEKYKRIWPYHMAQKSFYHLPFTDLEERMRWRNLPFYDLWMKFQTLPDGVNVVQAPMGSCEALFDLVDRSGRKALKVFDAPNSHPSNYEKIWQDECDVYLPGYRIPMARAARDKIRREIKNADLVLCPSNFVRDSMLQNGVSPDKCFISHFGVDTSIFGKRGSLPPTPRFICVGSLTVRKGHQYLFPAFAQVKEHFPSAELICVGGIRPDFSREFNKWRGTFTHLDGLSHKELSDLMRGCTAFIFPSLEEGFARVLSEAMACGLPILASYESGATTVVRDKHEGLIIKPRDIEGIAKAMIRMIQNPDENISMGERAYQAGAKSNTWKDYTQRLLVEFDKRLNFI